MTEDKALEGYTAEGVDRKEEELSLFCSQITLDPVWELLDAVTVNRGRNEIRLFFSASTKDCTFNSGKQPHKQTSGPGQGRNSLSGSGKGFCQSWCAMDWKDCGDHLVIVASCQKEMRKQRHRRDNWPL